MAVLKMDKYLPYKAEMLKKGWEIVNNPAVKKILHQMDAVSPYQGKEPGMEVGFTKFFSGKGIRATIWCTVEEEKGQTRDGWDAGHGVLTISNKVVYLAPDVYRTPTFFDRMLFLADLLEARAKSRPTCRHCGNLLDIAWTDAGQHYWYCKANTLDEAHPFITEQWDIGMPEQFVVFLKKRRRATQQYNIKRAAQNLPKKRQGKKRKRWTKNNPSH